MKYLKYIFLASIVLFFTISVAFGGLFGYNDGECDLFSITPPSDYHNAGELTYKDSLFLSTASHKTPYHAFRVDIVGDMNEDFKFSDSKEDGNFKFYRGTDDGVGNHTYAFYSHGNKIYKIDLWHKGCPYDDSQFNSDVSLIKSIAYSIKEK